MASTHGICKDKALYDKARPSKTERDWTESLNTRKLMKIGLQKAHAAMYQGYLKHKHSRCLDQSYPSQEMFGLP